MPAWNTQETNRIKVPLKAPLLEHVFMNRSELHVWLGFSGAVLSHVLAPVQGGCLYIPHKSSCSSVRGRSCSVCPSSLQNLSQLKGEAHYRGGFPFSHWALSVISVWRLPLAIICFLEGIPFFQLKWPLLGTKPSMCVGKELTQIVTTANGHCFAFQVTMTPDGKTWLCSGSP